MSTSQPHRPNGWVPSSVGTAGRCATVDRCDEQEPPAWRREATCRDFPTDLFFPVGHGPGAEAQTTRAKTICNQCPVRAECLHYALTTNAQFGVFGGMSEDERRRVRRNLARQVHMGPVPLNGKGDLEASA